MGAFLRDDDPERQAKNRKFNRQFRRIHFFGLAVGSAALCVRFAMLMIGDGATSIWGILEIGSIVMLGASLFAFIRLPGSKR